MGRETGIDFTVGVRGNYRKRATHLMKLNLVMAVDVGLVFHENKFSGLVYVLGEIPLEWNGEQ